MICAICDFDMPSRGCWPHLYYKHNLSIKEYYDMYLKQPKEGICKLANCSKETPFLGLSKGYQDHCCNSHAQLDFKTQNKIQKTCLKKYGVLSSNQSDTVKEKMKHTLIKRYGVDNCQKNKAINKRSINTRHITNFEKYGVLETSELQFVKDKISNSTKEYMLNRSQKEKDEFYHKIREIKRTHGTLSTSKPEENFYNWLLTIFEKSDIYRNYSDDSRYPFMRDFYIKSLDMFIELNLFWMHGFHWFNKNNINDVNKLNFWKEKAKQGHKQYKVAINVWVNSDLKKYNIVVKNNLNYIVLWNNEDILKFKEKIEGKLKK